MQNFLNDDFVFDTKIFIYEKDFFCGLIIFESMHSSFQETNFQLKTTVTNDSWM